MRSKGTAHGRRAKQGIAVRHSRSCRLRQGESDTCSCKPRYEASVWSQSAFEASHRSHDEALAKADRLMALIRDY